MSNYLLNTISLAINSKGGSFSSDFVERRRGGGTRAALRCRFKGPALRSVACLPTHPVLLNSTRPRKWGYMCGGESERRPPLRECGVFMWQCGVVCMAAGGKEREWEGGGRERERNNPSVKTTQGANGLECRHRVEAERIHFENADLNFCESTLSHST